uniref:Uncharacterized protein n=1 Tax=Panagrolaimus sp. JU765 TaxID=591449 RepID=A0AC34PVA5_9BILA
MLSQVLTAIFIFGLSSSNAKLNFCDYGPILTHVLDIDHPLPLITIMIVDEKWLDSPQILNSINQLECMFFADEFNSYTKIAVFHDSTKKPRILAKDLFKAKWLRNSHKPATKNSHKPATKLVDSGSGSNFYCETFIEIMTKFENVFEHNFFMNAAKNFVYFTNHIPDNDLLIHCRDAYNKFIEDGYSNMIGTFLYFLQPGNFSIIPVNISSPKVQDDPRFFFGHVFSLKSVENPRNYLNHWMIQQFSKKMLAEASIFAKIYGNYKNDQRFLRLNEAVFKNVTSINLIDPSREMTIRFIEGVIMIGLIITLILFTLCLLVCTAASGVAVDEQLALRLQLLRIEQLTSAEQNLQQSNDQNHENDEGEHHQQNSPNQKLQTSLQTSTVSSVENQTFVTDSTQSSLMDFPDDYTDE